MKNIYFSNIIYRKLRYLRSLYKVFIQYYFNINIYKIYIVNIPTHLHIPKTLTTFVTSKVTIMNTRLKQFIAAENITQAQLADNLNVVRASVSHILAGRNKPGYDFICGLMTHYPNLNIEWLMFGKGKMYKTQEQQTIFDTGVHETEDKDEISLLTDFTQPEMTVPEHTPAVQPVAQPEPGVTLNDIKTLVNTIQKPVNQRKLVKITAFFDDGTFQELTTM